MSAFAAAKLVYHLINDHPEILKIASIRQKSFHVNEESLIKMANWNWMLPGLRFGYKGLDGLKTGHTGSAGYCFTATARQNGVRLISVIMKAGFRRQCFEDTKKLLDYGFNNFSGKEFFPAGYKVTLGVLNGEKEQACVVTKKPLKKLIKNGEEKQYKISYELKRPHISDKAELLAPLKKGQFVGFLKVEYTGNQNYSYILPEGRRCERTEIFAAEDIKKASWYIMFMQKIKNWFVRCPVRNVADSCQR